jgi:hypothetical protein
MRSANHFFSRLTLTILLLPGVAPCAFAETVTETASKWGLIGSWSQDCSLAPDLNKGTVLSYLIVGGDRLVHRRNFGNASDDNEVVGAKVSADGMLNLRVLYPSIKQAREFGLMKQPDGSIRAMYNRSQKGEYTIKDGKFTADGNPTPPQYKCDQGVTQKKPAPRLMRGGHRFSLS